MWTCILAMCAQAASGVADDPPRETPPAAEILVTGERIERSVADTPSSVVVMTSQAIESTAADRLDQIVALIPNVQPGSGEEGPAIRGQDSTGLLRNLFAFLGGTRPRLTLQIDGRAVSYYEYVSATVPLWDLERIEVFRSPQTTTQGRNSIAGAIFVETRDPTYDWQGRSRIIVGGSSTRQVSGTISGPIIAGQVAIRASGDVRFSRTASDLADGIPGADIDRDDYGLGRIKLLVEPAGLPDLRIETAYAHTRSQSPQFEAVRKPFEERRSTVLERTNGVHKIRADSLTTRVEYRLSGEVVSALTLSYGDALVRRFGLPGLGRTEVDSRDVSVEWSAHWAPQTPVEVFGGAHILKTRQDQFIDITGLGIGSGEFEDRQSSLGLFGQVVWSPVHRLDITGGLRYQKDRQDRGGQVGHPQRGIFLDYDETFDAWLPKLVASYAVTSGITTGLMIQRAYNPGGTSVNLRTRAQDEFGAETLWNYEAFVRVSPPGKRAIISANLFYNDIADAQRQQLVSFPLPDGTAFEAVEFANAPKARTYGLETELNWTVNEAISARAGVGLLRTKLVKAVLAADSSQGKEFQRAPRFSASAGLDWRPAENVELSSQVRHHSSYFSDDANDSDLRIDDATIVDLRGAYSSGGRTVFVYLLNAFDSFHLTYLFNTDLGAAGDPRELGIGLDLRF